MISFCKILLHYKFIMFSFLDNKFVLNLIIMNSTNKNEQQQKQQVFGTAGDLIDLSPDLINNENMLNEFKNFKSDMLILTREMENIKMGNKKDLLEIGIKFNAKIASLNSSIDMINIGQNCEKLAKLEAEKIEMIGELKEKIDELKAENVELKSKNAKLMEAVGEIMDKLKNENGKKVPKVNKKGMENNSKKSKNGKKKNKKEKKKIAKEKKKQKKAVKNAANPPNSNALLIHSNEENVEGQGMQQQANENGMEPVEIEIQQFAAKEKHLERSAEGFELNSFEIMKYNKWNPNVSSPIVAFSDQNEFFLLYKNVANALYSVRAEYPVRFQEQEMFDKPYIAAYYEIKILQIKRNSSMGIGFSSDKFQLKGQVIGIGKDTIGIWDKEGINIDGTYNAFGDRGGFKIFNIIGIGLVHSSANLLKCFSTCNGTLLGMVDLPEKFIHLQLFPTATLALKGDYIRTNFGKELFLFDSLQLLQ